MRTLDSNNIARCISISILLLAMLASYSYAQSIENGQVVEDIYKPNCDVHQAKGACGGTCTDTKAIPTDACTIDITLSEAAVDDEGNVTSGTTTLWNYNGCSCDCKEEGGGGCAVRTGVNLPISFTRGSPVSVTAYGRNDCEATTKPQGNDIFGHADATIKLTRAQCTDGYECKSDTGVVQCIKICGPPPDSEAIEGEIRYVECLGAEFLSDAATWVICDGQFWKKEVAGRDYLCIGKGKGSIAECCGDGLCKSNSDGQQKNTGGNLIPSSYGGESPVQDSKTYYCRADKKFVTDLDTPGAQSTCEKAGFKWTGTKCCSEADDKICTSQFSGNSCPSEFSGCMLQSNEGCTKTEYYNDPGTAGGCWASKFMKIITIPNGTGDSVINYDGVFRGCTVKDPELLALKDSSGSPLITNHPLCFMDPLKTYYCSGWGKWNLTRGADKSHLSKTPPSVNDILLESECCAQGQCWNGTKCINNQKNDPNAKPTGASSRCIDGEWTNSNLKYTPDGDPGYCPKDSQCLLNPLAQNEKDQCIESGDYTTTGDNYCENGEWSSRTKLLALKLLELRIPNEDFVLFCDSKENTLNDLKYQLESKEISRILDADIQANNFCVLKTAGTVVLATSINQNLNNTLTKNIFGVKTCTNSDHLKNDGKYNRCNSENKLWLNNKMKTFVYSTTQLQAEPSTGQFSSYIKGIIDGILSTVRSIMGSTPPSESYFNSYVRGLNKFERLYLSEQGNKAIIGSLAGKDLKTALVEYRSFSTDVCKYISQFNTENSDAASRLSCRTDGTKQHVLAHGTRFTSINPELIWPDLTSKLRVK